VGRARGGGVAAAITPRPGSASVHARRDRPHGFPVVPTFGPEFSRPNRIFRRLRRIRYTR